MTVCSRCQHEIFKDVSDTLVGHEITFLQQSEERGIQIIGLANGVYVSFHVRDGRVVIGRHKTKEEARFAAR
jgi:hypothetical protein